MKSPDFAYAKPGSLAEALELLADGDQDAMPLAGGQSLMPMLNFRLAAPDTLVDINGLEELRGIADLANRAERQPAPVSAITVGMQCGGSDGYSGITANPALGYASDLLVQHGGTTILSETSEIYGAEHLLTRRAETV